MLELIQLISPLVFSIIILLVNVIINDNSKDKEIRQNLLSKHNKTIFEYNVIQTALRNHTNTKLTLLVQSISIIEDFFENNHSTALYNDWLHKRKYNLFVSNEKELRKMLREYCHDITDKQNNNIAHNNSLKLLANAQIYQNFSIPNISKDEEMFFINHMRNEVADIKEKDILNIALDILSYGSSSGFAMRKYNDSVQKLHTSLISTKENQRIDHDILYESIIQLMFLVETLSSDFWILSEATKILNESFSKYHTSLHSAFPEIEDIISFRKINFHEPVINRHLHEKTILAHYDIGN